MDLDYNWWHCARFLSIGIIMSDHIQSTTLVMMFWLTLYSTCNEKINLSSLAFRNGRS